MIKELLARFGYVPEGDATSEEIERLSEELRVALAREQIVKDDLALLEVRVNDLRRLAGSLRDKIVENGKQKLTAEDAEALALVRLERARQLSLNLVPA